MQRFTPSTVRATVATGAFAVALTAITTSVAHAQADLTLGPFLGYERLVLNDPATIGLDITGFVGSIGLRGSAALPRRAFRSTNSTNINDPYNEDRLKNWSADGDILFRLIDRNASHGAFLYGFAGMGVQDRSAPNTGTFDPTYQNVRANWSYGIGLTLPLGALSLTGEARQHRPFDYQGATSTEMTPWREYRLGLSLHFGSGGGSRYRTSRHRIASNSTSTSTVAATAATVLSTTASSGTSARRVLPTAERYLGVPYVYGGTSPKTGFDCSGFVQYVFAKHGVRLPRTSRQQAQVGSWMPARFGALAPGDLAMFAEDGGRISHVAIYAGGNRIIHATSSGGEVRYDDLDTPRGQWFVEHIVAARRIGGVDTNGLLLDLAKGFSTAVELDLGDRAPQIKRFIR